MNAIFLHDYPLAVEPASTPRPLVQKKTWRDSLPIDMLLSAVSVLVVAQLSSEIAEGLMNNPVYLYFLHLICVYDKADTENRTRRQQLRMAFGFQATVTLFSLKMVGEYRNILQELNQCMN